jgi:hypothetical protein
MESGNNLRRLGFMAVDAVSSDPVSAQKFPLTGKNTGKMLPFFPARPSKTRFHPHF